MNVPIIWEADPRKSRRLEDPKKCGTAPPADMPGTFEKSVEFQEPHFLGYHNRWTNSEGVPGYLQACRLPSQSLSGLTPFQSRVIGE